MTRTAAPAARGRTEPTSIAFAAVMDHVDVNDRAIATDAARNAK
jgi:hypothetical protein